MTQPVNTSPIERMMRFIVSPSPIPDDLENIESLSGYGTKLLKEYVSSALATSMLPETLILGHYLHIPPAPHRTPFRVPVIARQDVASKALAAFAYFRNPDRPKHLSLMERVLRNKQDGLTFVISSSKKQAEPVLSEYIHVQLSIPVEAEASAIDLAGELLKGLNPERVYESSNGSWCIYSESDVGAIFNSYRVAAQFADSVDPHFETTEKGRKLLEGLFGGKISDYFRRIVRMVQVGTVMFCIPKLYPHDQQFRDVGSVFGGGGCAFILSAPPDSQTLDNLYVFSHKMCSVASNIYDVARVVSDKRTKKEHEELLKGIAHSLGNTISKKITTNTPTDMVQRLLKLEELTIEAASMLVVNPEIPDTILWSQAGFDGESVGTTIRKAISDFDFELNIDDEILDGRLVDSKLAAIVAELGRNLEKRRAPDRKSGLIVIRRNLSSEACVDIEVSTTCSHSDAQNIYQRMRGVSKFRGINWIYTLASKMFESNASQVAWSFAYLNSDSSEASETRPQGHTGWKVIGPASIFDEDAMVRKQLRMTFMAQRLKAIVQEAQS